MISTVKKIILSGSSGLIGTALKQQLSALGHQVISLVRDKEKVGKGQVYWNPEENFIQKKDLEGAYAVIHLGGEGIADSRWTASRKQQLIKSRVQTTELLSKTLAGLKEKPSLFITASAIGYYGNRGAEVLNESSEAGRGFLADTAVQWEGATALASSSGIRTIHLRFGIVLAKQGGALAKMLTPFGMGLGAIFGNGQQAWSWVSLDDVIGSIQHLLFRDTHISGPVNIVSPGVVSYGTFAKTLGRVIKRPVLARVPAFMVKLIFGQMGEEIFLGSQNVTPQKLIESGYQFSHTEIETTLKQLLG